MTSLRQRMIILANSPHAAPAPSKALGKLSAPSVMPAPIRTGAKPAMTGKIPPAARPRRSPALSAAERCGISALSLPGAAIIRPADHRMCCREPAPYLDPDSADILPANRPAPPRAPPHAPHGPKTPSIFVCSTPKPGSCRKQPPQPDNNRHTASPVRRLSPHTSHIAKRPRRYRTTAPSFNRIE